MGEGGIEQILRACVCVCTQSAIGTLYAWRIQLHHNCALTCLTYQDTLNGPTYQSPSLSQYASVEMLYACLRKPSRNVLTHGGALFLVQLLKLFDQSKIKGPR